MDKGIVFNIQKFSIHDGPGIRTTVFLKGCPLRCQWCSNPESQLEKVQILYDQNKCIHCQKCINICPQQAISVSNNYIHIDFEKCTGCLQCVNNCPTDCLSYEGEFKTVEEVVKICLQDKDFYDESNGGVTISGGEGMIQPAFVLKLIQALKEKQIHVAIETTGYIESTTFKNLAKMFDLLLFDVKHYDSQKHFDATAVYNELIIDNLKWAITHQINVLPRIPIIPDFNDSLNDANQLAKLLIAVGATRVQLLPFHQFGERKYELLNRTYQFKNKKALHPENLTEYRQVFLDKGLECFF